MATAEKLAINGGTPVVSATDHHDWPDVQPEDREAVLAVLDRGIFHGPYAPEITALESDWAQYLGVAYCVALNSGTAALHCCAAAAGLEPGDEVIVPAYTFVASAMGIAHQGAVPVFCDIDLRSHNLDPKKIEERITDRTRAILPVHIQGLPADMDEISAIGERRGLVVIEDAAQSHGATYKGQKTGTLAFCAGFSVNATKNLSGGEGGLFVTHDKDAFVAARRLSVFGEDVLPLKPGEGRLYWSHGVGWNYRSQELPAAFARSQLRRLDAYNANVQANAEILNDGLSRLRGVTPPHVPDDRTSVYHKYRVRLDPNELGFDGAATELRDRIIQALRSEGVETYIWQAYPLPAYPAFRRDLRPWHKRRESETLRNWDPAEFPVASRLLDESLILGSEARPLFIQEAALMERYVEAFEKVLANLESVLAAPLQPVKLR